jgi:hypothetical protein
MVFLPYPRLLTAVMAGHSHPKDGVASARLCPAIHVLLCFRKEDVDARHKAGHDENNSERLLR